MLISKARQFFKELSDTNDKNWRRQHRKTNYSSLSATSSKLQLYPYHGARYGDAIFASCAAGRRTGPANY